MPAFSGGTTATVQEEQGECNTTISGKDNLPHSAFWSQHLTSLTRAETHCRSPPGLSRDSPLGIRLKAQSLRCCYLHQVQMGRGSSGVMPHNYLSTVLLFSIPVKCRAFATPPVCPVCVHGITTLEPPIPKWGGAMKGTEEWSVVILKSS